MRLPYLYEAKIVRPRHRIPETFVAKAFGEFEVPEATAAQAPLATGWVHQDAYARYGARSFPDGPPADVTRFHGGRLYREVAGGISPSDYVDGLSAEEGRFSRGPDPVADGYPRQAGGALRESFRSVLNHDTIEHLGERLAEGRGHSRLREDDRVARLAEVTALYPATLLVVDGRMWSSENCREPHYEVTRDGHGREVRVRVSQAPNGMSDAHASCHKFRADRRAEAFAFAADLAARHGCPVPTLTTDRVTVHHAPSVTLDQTVCLAFQLVHGFRMAPDRRMVEDRMVPDPMPDEVGRLALEMLAVKEAPVHDLAWALRAITDAERLVAALDGEGIDRRDFGMSHLDDVLARWRDLEGPERVGVLAHHGREEPDVSGMRL